MSNYENEKVPYITVALIIVGVFGLGYFLASTSPQKNQSAKSGIAASATNTVQQNNMVDHHGNANTGVNTSLLNSFVGKPLPSLELKDKDGNVFGSDKIKGKYTVLFFNEGLMCYPGCWNQIAAFGSDSRFNTADVQAISIVVDSVQDWQRAIEKMPKLSSAKTMHDTGAKASSQLGMLTAASSMHRGSLPGHTYVLVDKEGIVRYVYDDPRMAIANDALWNKIQELNK